METFLFILEFFAGLILIFAISWFIGKLLKLDQHHEAYLMEKTRINKKN